jgi:TetR/AcrR family transcriptional repressor of nem operon
MKVSKETSAKHRDELLNAASRLFRERGFDKVGIAEIAAAAGLTHGAFYTHFESKEALCAEVIALAAGRSRAAQDSRPNWRAAFEAYLSPKHARDSRHWLPVCCAGRRRAAREGDDQDGLLRGTKAAHRGGRRRRDPHLCRPD